MAQVGYESLQTPQSTNKNSVGFFSIKEDGAEALVRFLHDDTNSFDIVSTHSVTVGDKFRKISCLRNSLRDPVEKCPLCAANQAFSQRIFVRLLQYTKDENGNIVAEPKVWERSAMFARDLKAKMDEYGPLSQVLFKVQRHGKKGEKTTSYSIDFANPMKYKPELFPIDGSAFEKFKALGTIVMDKPFADLTTFIQTGAFPEVMADSIPQTMEPSYTAAPAAPTYQQPAYQAPAAPQYQAPAQPQYQAPAERAPWETDVPQTTAAPKYAKPNVNF